MMNRFFIADLHLGHANCLAYDNRPFKDIYEQDEFIIQHWNSAVREHDEVWILGDISWYSPNKTSEILSQLNGNKFLCRGNHDERLLKNSKFREQFVDIFDYKELKLEDGNGIVLCHYPLPCYNRHFYGWYHLYGHVHNSFESNMIERFQSEMVDLYSRQSNMYNVGCMNPWIGYVPRTLEEIVQRYNEYRKAIMYEEGDNR